MKVITAKKTTTLIKMADKKNGYIICFSMQEANRVFAKALKMDCLINYPLLFDQFIKGQYAASEVKKVYVDNVNMCLESISKVYIEAVALTVKVEDE